LKLLATEPLVARLADGLSAEARALLTPPPTGVPPGSVLATIPGIGLVLASGGCPLLLRQAQLEGKAAAEGQSLIQQLDARPGDRLGDAA
jgi:methionyl-tRNA formyltransferase